MPDKVKISGLPFFGSFSHAVQNNVMFPVAQGSQNTARIGAADIATFMNQLILTALNGYAELTDLNALRDEFESIINNLPSSPGGGGGITLNRTVGYDDSITTPVQDAGGNISVPVGVTAPTPSASSTQITPGVKTLRSAITTIVNNIAYLFEKSAANYLPNETENANSVGVLDNASLEMHEDAWIYMDADGFLEMIESANIYMQNSEIYMRYDSKIDMYNSHLRLTSGNIEFRKILSSEESSQETNSEYSEISSLPGFEHTYMVNLADDELSGYIMAFNICDFNLYFNIITREDTESPFQEEGWEHYGLSEWDVLGMINQIVGGIEIPTSLPPNGPAGGDLAGTYPNPSLATVTRTNSTSAASPAAGATFTAIDTVATDTKGRVTAVNTKTVTLPAAGGGSSGGEPEWPRFISDYSATEWRHLGSIDATYNDSNNFNGVLNIYSRSNNSNTSMLASVYISIPTVFITYKIAASYIGQVAPGFSMWFTETQTAGSGTGSGSAFRFDFWTRRDAGGSTYAALVEVVGGSTGTFTPSPNASGSVPASPTTSTATQINSLLGGGGGGAALNRQVAYNDDSTAAVTDTGGNISVPVGVTAPTPSSNSTQITSGVKTLREAITTIVNNIAYLFINKQNTLTAGNVAQVRMGDHSLSPGYVHFLTEMTGIYQNVPIMPGFYGSYIVCLSTDKLKGYVIAHMSCIESPSSGLCSCAITRSDTSQNFTAAGWHEYASISDFNSILIRVANLEGDNPRNAIETNSQNINPNTYLSPGLWYGGFLINSNNTFGYLEVRPIKYSTSHLMQTFTTEAANPIIYIRNRYSSTWGTWRQI